MTAASRRLDHRALSTWLADTNTPRAESSVLETLAQLVDSRSGASHPRYPITLARIAHLARYSVASVCRALNNLSAFVRRRKMPARRRDDGTIRQEPTDYELTLPDELWRIVHRPEDTTAARVPGPQPVRVPQEQWSRKVRGKLSERIDSKHLPARGWQLDPVACWTFVDEVHADDLAPQLLEVAQLALEGVDDLIRHRAMVCLNELRKRAHDVALLGCNLALMASDVRSAVRAWAVRAVGNASQRIDSAEHAMNILRRFVHEQLAWSFGGKGTARVVELAEAKRRRNGVIGCHEQRSSWHVDAEARAHIAVKRA